MTDCCFGGADLCSTQPPISPKQDKPVQQDNGSRLQETRHSVEPASTDASQAMPSTGTAVRSFE